MGLGGCRGPVRVSARSAPRANCILRLALRFCGISAFPQLKQLLRRVAWRMQFAGHVRVDTRRGDLSAAGRPQLHKTYHKHERLE